MAIVQISRITHRKGLIENLPQLAGGELGWAVDSRRLFIGNGTLVEGAPVVGNTEILTEYSDVLNIANYYTYVGNNGGYAAQTGATSTGNVVRSLQDKFDDFASVRDFGAVGDGDTDDTDAINRALYQLFCREANEEVRRSLFFPAGVYLVSGTIKIPPYAKLYGEGANSTTIRYTSLDGSTVDDYVVRTADSLQQTGANIGNNGATPPRNIEVSSMSFETTNATMDILLLDKVNQGSFTNVNFKGPLVESDLSDALDDTKVITVESTTSLVTKQVTFDKCHISGATYGVYDNYNAAGITFSNGTFETLYRGVVLGESPVNGGPTGVRIMHNLFDHISAQGIQIGAVSYNVSAFNFFKDVGNDFSGTGNPATTVVSINDANNLSYGDLFERTDIDSESFKRIELNDTHSVAISSHGFRLSNYERTLGYQTTLADNTSAATAIFTLNADQVSGYLVDFTIKRGDAIRTGRMSCTVGYGSNTPTFIEDYSESAACGVSFTADQTGTTISFKFQTTSTGTDAILTYSIAKFIR